MILFFTTLLLFVIYSFSIGYLYFNFPKSSPEIKVSSSIQAVSIIIPFRNEASNLLMLFNELENCVSEKDEVLLINDHSEDNWKMIEPQIGQYANFKFLNLNEKKGKKEAILLGLKNASNENIITVDADVRLQRNWLNIVKAGFEDKDVGMIVLPVIFSNLRTLSERLGTMEFIALTGITFSFAAMGHPILANGANLAIKKKAYLELEDELQLSTASGDDIFLLNAIRESGRWKITYQNNPEAAVFTQAPNSFEALVSQRVRWIGKMKSMFKGKASLLALVTLLTTQLIFIGLIISITNGLGKYFAVLWGVKMLIDYFFLHKIARHFNQLKALRYYPLLALIYPFYLLVILFALFRGKTSWKGREIKV